MDLKLFCFSGFEFWVILFSGFEFRLILFLWVVEICAGTSIPFKEMLVCLLALPLLGLLLELIKIKASPLGIYVASTFRNLSTLVLFINLRKCSTVVLSGSKQH